MPLGVFVALVYLNVYDSVKKHYTHHHILIFYLMSAIDYGRYNGA